MRALTVHRDDTTRENPHSDEPPSILVSGSYPRAPRIRCARGSGQKGAGSGDGGCPSARRTQLRLSCWLLPWLERAWWRAGERVGRGGPWQTRRAPVAWGASGLRLRGGGRGTTHAAPHSTSAPARRHLLIGCSRQKEKNICRRKRITIRQDLIEASIDAYLSRRPPARAACPLRRRPAA